MKVMANNNACPVPILILFVALVSTLVMGCSPSAPNSGSSSSGKTNEEVWVEFHRKSELQIWQEKAKQEVGCFYYYAKVFEKDINESYLDCSLGVLSGPYQVSSKALSFELFDLALASRLEEDLSAEDREMLEKLNSLFQANVEELKRIKTQTFQEIRTLSDEISALFDSEGCGVEQSTGDIVCLNYCLASSKYLILQQRYLNFLSRKVTLLPASERNDQVQVPEIIKLNNLMDQMDAFLQDHLGPLDELRRTERVESKCSDIRISAPNQ